MKAYVTVGVSASGKTTWAKTQTKFQTISRDDIRAKLQDREGRSVDWSKWSFRREDEVSKIQEDQIKTAAHNKIDIIIADTNLSARTRDHVINLLSRVGYDVEIKEFDVDLTVAWKRDAGREGGVGHQVIYEQYQKWLEYKGRKRYVPDPKLPKVFLVDVDGTLAHMNNKRGAFEWNKVGVDDVDKAVRLVVNACSAMAKIIVLSGRDGVCYPETKKWLVDNKVEHDDLIMRAKDDMRKDSVIKEELFWKHIAPNYNVVGVFDDRPQVVRMWMELGVKVFSVGNPYKEF